MNTELRDALANGFPADKIQRKPGQGGRTMNYISHAVITERLNQVDPGWSWVPLQTYTYTDPKTGRLHCEGVEVLLTIGGVARVEAGGPTRQDGFANEIKNAYSDAIKRGAMRFGVALAMWSGLVDAEYDEDTQAEEAPQGISPADFGSIMADARAMHAKPTPYEAVVAYLREFKPDMNEAQTEEVKRFIKGIAPKPERDGAATPARPFASVAG